MRPRIRSVKPDLFHDEKLWALGADTGLPVLQGFQGLWCYADREGRFEWRPRALQSLILPYWSGDFERLLAVLVSAGMVVRYTVEGRAYGLVRNFKKHQVLNNRELPSTLPEPRDEDASGTRDPRVSDQSEWIGNGNGKGVGVGTGVGVDARAHEPDPPSAPIAAPVAPPVPNRPGTGGVTRTFSLPSAEPPGAYLDEAVMRGVSREQAASTWKHYFGAGLPAHGVERLYPWLLQRALERANSVATLARAGPARAGSDTFTANRIAHIERLRTEESEEAEP